MKTKKVMTVENLLQSLNVIADEDEATERMRKRRKKKFKRAYREGMLHFDWTFENARDAYKLCVAEQINGRYHWAGWECRENATWALASGDFVFPRWDGSDCKLLVLAEQGIGDEILFASCFPDLLRQCPRATIECDPRLLPVFQRSFDAEFITRWNDLGKGKGLDDYKKVEGKYDAFVPAGELPKIYRRSREDFPGEPYLQANSPRDYFGTKVYGISWIGRQGTIDPQDLVVFKGQYIDLQYGDHESPDWAWSTGVDNKVDIDAIFTIVAGLEAVITIPNTLAHIGGSLGITTHVVRPEAIYAGDNPDEPWFHNRLRWEFGLFNGRTPWYNSVRTYRSVREFRMKRGQNHG